jgi:hypothetical protein
MLLAEARHQEPASKRRLPSLRLMPAFLDLPDIHEKLTSADQPAAIV